jgi:DNA-binding LacI/PurR family transcriptional regulator
MPTISDVSKLAGVSKTTVSRVLNSPELVNAETRERVLAVIEKLDYSPSIIARGMRSQKTRMIGIILPDIANLYYSEFLKNVEAESMRNGYIAVICSTETNPQREREYIEQLVKRQIDGLILCRYKAVEQNESFLRSIGKKLPIVVTDQPSKGLPISAVYTDAFQGFRDVTKYLLDRGYKRIAMLSGRRCYPFAAMRFGGYAAALRDRSIAVDESLVQECECTVAGGFGAVENILKRTRPDAVVAVTDLVAMGALRCLQERGYSIPQEIAITGFDNIPISSLASPQLTTVAQPIDRMATEAVGQLIKRIQNSRVRNRDIVLRNTLVIRESTEERQRDEILM